MKYFVHHSGACKCSLECVPIKKHPSGTNWFGHTENVPIFLHIWETMKNVNKLQSLHAALKRCLVCFVESYRGAPFCLTVRPKADSARLHLLYISRRWFTSAANAANPEMVPGLGVRLPALNEHLQNRNSATTFWSTIKNTCLTLQNNNMLEYTVNFVWEITFKSVPSCEGKKNCRFTYNTHSHEHTQ